MEIVAKQLGKREDDLVSADTMIVMLIDELVALKTNVSRILAESIVVRYVQRRNSVVLNLMKYLKGTDVDEYKSLSYPLPPGELIILGIFENMKFAFGTITMSP